MNPTCKTPGCTRSVHAACMCRRCRNREIHGGDVVMTHTVGEVQHLMRRILEHYPTARDAIRACGMSSETFYRIMRKDTRASLKTPTYQRIMAAAEVLNGPPIEANPGEASWPDAAAYARTPEGREYIERCRAPRKYRRYMEVAA